MAKGVNTKFLGTSQVPVKICDLHNCKIAYRDTGGTGHPVILLHALAGSGESWTPQFDALKAAGYRAIAPDRYGWGDSPPSPDKASDPGTAAEDLDEFVDCLGIERFDLVGIAGGGFVALDYAAWRPDRLRRLVVAASTGKIDERAVRDFIGRISNPEVTWPSRFLEVGLSYMGSNPQGMAEWDRLYQYSRRHGTEEQALRSENTFQKIRGIDIPTLVLAGGADQLAPPSLMRLWVGHLPDHRFQTIPNAGHSMNWEWPDDFNRHVLEFLNSAK